VDADTALCGEDCVLLAAGDFFGEELRPDEPPPLDAFCHTASSSYNASASSPSSPAASLRRAFLLADAEDFDPVCTCDRLPCGVLGAALRFAGVDGVFFELLAAGEDVRAPLEAPWDPLEAPLEDPALELSLDDEALDDDELFSWDTARLPAGAKSSSSVSSAMVRFFAGAAGDLGDVPEAFFLDESSAVLTGEGPEDTIVPEFVLTKLLKSPSRGIRSSVAAAAATALALGCSAVCVFVGLVGVRLVVSALGLPQF